MTVFSSVQSLIEILRQIEARDSETLAAYPELAALLVISSAQNAVLAIEHAAGDINPVWAHLGLPRMMPLAFRTSRSWGWRILPPLSVFIARSVISLG